MLVTGPIKGSNNNNNYNIESSKKEQDSEAETQGIREKDDEVCKTANFTERKKLIKSNRAIQQGLKVWMCFPLY